MSDDEEKQNEAYSKLRVAFISGVTAIVVSLVSSVGAFWVASDRLALDDTVSKAKLFSDLIARIGEAESANYALLALWKIYPEDRKLIVITALQNPSPAVISTLRAIGLDEELTEFKDTIKAIYQISPANNQSRIRDLFLSLDAKGVLELSLEQLLEDPAHQHFGDEFYNLTSLLVANKELVVDLVGLYKSDPRIQQSPDHKIEMAVILYNAGHKDELENLLVEFGDSPQTFNTIAPLLAQAVAQSQFSVRSYEHFLSLSLEALKLLPKQFDGEAEHQFNDIMDIVLMSLPKVRHSANEFAQLKEILNSWYQLGREDSFTRKRILAAFDHLDGSLSRKLFVHSLVCDDQASADFLFQMTEYGSRYYGHLGSPLGFAAVRQEATSELREQGENCGGSASL